jgi:hypothetical protein
MFMRFLGGGIGHKVTESVPQRRPESGREAAEPDIWEEEIVAEDAEDEPQVEDMALEEDLDVEEVDLDEEADFGYVDREESAAESDPDADSEDDENI